MMIVDAQVHIWQEDTPGRPWPPGQAGRAHRSEPLTAAGLLAEMDEAGVSRTVLVPPSWEGDRNDLSQAAAEAHPDRFAVMGRLSLTDPASRALLRTLRQQPGMLGLRFTFHTEKQRPWLTDGTADWLWPAAEAAGVPLMILPPGSLPQVAVIAERHPALRLVIDHLALTRGRSEDEAFAHMPELLALAQRPNVAVKATALPTYSSEAYPYLGLHKHIRSVYDAFGPKRMFWGSDLSRLSCTYRQCVTLFTEELPWLSETDKEDIMGRGLCEWLGWPINGLGARQVQP
jgi:L-fuconolactonase